MRSGQDFPSRAFAALIRSGLAPSPRVADAAGQEQFGFDRREEINLHLPRCEMTGGTSDVHLVQLCRQNLGDGQFPLNRLGNVV